MGREVLELRVAPGDVAALAGRRPRAEPRGHEVDGDLLVLFTDDAEALHARGAGRGRADPPAGRPAPPGLEDVFLRVTGRRLRD